ncbi:MAG: VWA domain-containing protein, partial [Verrucomicrobiae bacterium]|nr:VWA domain-containing protein [Verrucomicrobiae bacterium]
MMEWTHPWMLTGLLGIAWLFHGVRRSLAGMTKAQRWTCLSLRALIFSLIVLALAGPRWIRQVDRLAVVYLLDESLSVPPEAQEKARAFVNESLAARRSDDQAAVLGFAASPRVISPMSEKASVPAWQAPPDQDRKATDIARALESAAALFPPESLKRIVLLSDGNATAGDPVEEAVRLAGEEVRVDTVALAGPERPEVLARELSLPHEIRPGEPFQLTARIQSTVKQAAKVKLLENKFVLGEKTVELQPGENQIDFETRAGENGFHAYETQVEAPSDTRLENNRALATAIISGTPRVLLVEAEEDKARYLSSALRDEHIDVVVRNGLGVPTSLEDLQNFNLFILSDVAALELSP